MKREGIFWTSLYHLHQLHGHLPIGQEITDDSLPLHIASSRTRTEESLIFGLSTLLTLLRCFCKCFIIPKKMIFTSLNVHILLICRIQLVIFVSFRPSEKSLFVKATNDNNLWGLIIWINVESNLLAFSALIIVIGNR